LTLDPLEYRPPFCTEADEPVIEDCVSASTLMLTATETLGECLLDEHWQQKDLKHLRERMRNTLGPGKQHGGLTLNDADEMRRNVWPDLPQLRRWDAPNGTNLDLSFDELWDKLRNGCAALVIGNPIRVSDRSSPLRTKQTNDDYRHCVFVLFAEQARCWLMDPLGHGDYEGEWLPIQHLRAFAGEFGTPHDRGCAIVKRGAQSREARTARRLMVKP
jgi:hypothetical protein